MGSFKSRKERLGPVSIPPPAPAPATFQIPEGTFGTPRTAPPTPGRTRVSNPGRNVWDAVGGVAWDEHGDMFQIPEGTFGTAYAGGFIFCPKRSFKSRKERLGRGSTAAKPSLSASFKSRKERLGRRSYRGGRALRPRFKSRKERLGRVIARGLALLAGLFQIPEGTFGTQHRPPGRPPWPLVSNPGRNVWDPDPLHPRLEGREVSNPGRNVWDVFCTGYSHKASRQFQIPEGTFGTFFPLQVQVLGGDVSNPGRNVWDSQRPASKTFSNRVSNPGRNVWDTE